MPAAYSNLYIEAGTTFSATVTIDDVYQEIYDLILENFLNELKNNKTSDPDRKKRRENTSSL